MKKSVLFPAVFTAILFSGCYTESASAHKSYADSAPAPEAASAPAPIKMMELPPPAVLAGGPLWSRAAM